MAENTEKKNLFSLKNIFFILIIISFAQPMIIKVKKQVQEAVSPNTYFGALKVPALVYDSSYYVKHINKFLKNDNVKGLLLKINCRGGLPGASQAVFNELNKFKLKKPVVAIIEDFAASGGYYIASAADKIVSNPSAIVGSIGVYMQLPNVKRLLNDYNVSMDIKTAGRYKDATSPFTDRTPDQDMHLKAVVDDSYDQFTKDIASARGVAFDNRAVWADGKIFTGNQALKINLVDKTGSISDAKDTIREVMENRGIQVEGDIKFIYPRRQTGFEKFMYGEENEEDVETSMSFQLASFATSVVNHFTNLNSNNEMKF